jgi:hypothetical protein
VIAGVELQPRTRAGGEGAAVKTSGTVDRAPRGPKPWVSPALASWPAGLEYRRVGPVCVSVTVRLYSTLDRAP